MRIVAVLFALSLLDALTTYVAVSSGVGVEANPALADLVNSDPATIFPIALTSATLASVVAVAVDRVTRRLPAPIRVKVMRLVTAAYAAAVLIRSVAVVSNLLLLFS